MLYSPPCGRKRRARCRQPVCSVSIVLCKAGWCVGTHLVRHFGRGGLGGLGGGEELKVADTFLVFESAQCETRTPSHGGCLSASLDPSGQNRPSANFDPAAPPPSTSSHGSFNQCRKPRQVAPFATHPFAQPFRAHVVELLFLTGMWH